jgi:hypothetical protein
MWSGRGGKGKSPCWDRTPVVHPVASHYTEWQRLNQLSIYFLLMCYRIDSYFNYPSSRLSEIHQLELFRITETPVNLQIIFIISLIRTFRHF